MTTKQVTVTKYIACDNQVFNTRSECEAHEREVRLTLEDEVWELSKRKRELLYAINEARIKARIAWLDARKLKPEVRGAMDKCRYCALMSNYWSRTSEYNTKRRELFEVRRKISMVIDSLYMGFGLHKKQSSVARLERRSRSDSWRKENPPDKWRTPNKIRVSKQPKEEQ